MMMNARLGVVLAVLALAGCGGVGAATSAPTVTVTAAAPTSEAPVMMTASGHIDLGIPGTRPLDGEICTGDGGYGDIKFGAQVKVTDAAGALLALGGLEVGTLTNQYNIAGRTWDTCRFTFTVEDVPWGEKFYGVEVSHRGVVQIESSKLKVIELTLG